MAQEAAASESADSGATDLAERIARQITLGTWGRIHDLAVAVSAGRVTVRGRTPSHYVKQLVLQAVFDVIGSDSTMPVDFEIRVGRPDRTVLQGDDDLWGVPRFPRSSTDAG